MSALRPSQKQLEFTEPAIKERKNTMFLFTIPETNSVNQQPDMVVMTLAVCIKLSKMPLWTFLLEQEEKESWGDLLPSPARPGWGRVKGQCICREQNKAD